jgi:hypothetical protein
MELLQNIPAKQVLGDEVILVYHEDLKMLEK